MRTSKPESFQVLFVASEAVPFAKTGGLADVVGTLPKLLKQIGCDVRVVLPFYQVIQQSNGSFDRCLKKIPVIVSGENTPADIFVTTMAEDIPCYLVKQDTFFNRPHLYGNTDGDYSDNDHRFIYFNKAVFSLCQAMSLFPDVLHCHDWQTGLIPAYLRTLYGRDPGFQHTRTLLTIHNLAYQGIFPAETFSLTGLPDLFFSMEGMEFWGKANFMKAGISAADLLNTVSPSYCKEILTTDFGYGLEGSLAGREEDLYGILNGADYEEWDPAGDQFLPVRYDLNHMEGKQACKAALQEEMGIKAGEQDAPLFGMISRLTYQKGVDLVLAAGQDMMASGANFVLLGEGEDAYQVDLKRLEDRFPGRFAVRIGFDSALAHRIQAGCDFLLMPSRYEPCGLNQIYAMRYGTVPVVRATGGLKDTVTEFHSRSGKGTGFLFYGYDPAALLEAVQGAVRLYKRGGKSWGRIRRNCMQQIFSWDRSAHAYLELYQKLKIMNLKQTI